MLDELLPALLPVDDEPVPDDEEAEPEPVSLEVVPGVAVEAVVEDVLSLVVDELVGAVELAGVEVFPELLYEVLVPGVLLHPARAPVARAMAAT